MPAPARRPTAPPKKTKQRAVPAQASPKPPRLQKVLASAGFGSRRECEQLILDGRVQLDGQVVTELGTRVDMATQTLRVDGEQVKSPRRKVFALHKPPGIVCTARDPWARTRVIDLVDDPDRLFTVGRLDKESSGLILLTNDGQLADRLTHPRYGVSKVYRVTVAGKPDTRVLRQLREGVHLAEGKTRVEGLRLHRGGAQKSILEITLAEGKNREIRRILARVGHKVLQLKRITIGSLRLGDLPVGGYRPLKAGEIAALERSVGGPTSTTTRRRPKRSAGGRPKRKTTDTKRAATKRTAAKPNATKRAATRRGRR